MMKLIKISLMPLLVVFTQVVWANDPIPRPVFNCTSGSNYNTCLNEYNRQVQAYNQAQGMVNRGQLITASSTGITAPPAPNYSSCNSDQLCIQGLQAQYQRDLASYNEIKRLEQVAAQQQAAAQQQYNSAQAAAVAAQEANRNGQQKFQISQVLTQVAAMAAAAKFASTCPACQYQWLAVSVAMTAYSMMAGKQSKAHEAAKFTACGVANQISSSQSNCGPEPIPFNPATFPQSSLPTEFANVVDANGNCTASADICSQITSSLPPGTSLRDYQRGLSAFASGKIPLKINPDGSVTRTTDGKKFDASAFDTYEEMVAAGMSPELAKATLAAMSKGSSTDALNAVAELDKSTSGTPNLGSYDEATGGGAGKSGVVGVNGDLDGNGIPDSEDLSAKRALASAEGLVRDYNGESIGVKADDIFKMMNRRYILKDKQDSFISNPAP